MLMVVRNTLYYGDNLEILRLHIPDESVDLVYLDPPFKSARVSQGVFVTASGVFLVQALRIRARASRVKEAALGGRPVA